MVHATKSGYWAHLAKCYSVAPDSLPSRHFVPCRTAFCTPWSVHAMVQVRIQKNVSVLIYFEHEILFSVNLHCFIDFPVCVLITSNTFAWFLDAFVYYFLCLCLIFYSALAFESKTGIKKKVSCLFVLPDYLHLCQISFNRSIHSLDYKI